MRAILLSCGFTSSASPYGESFQKKLSVNDMPYMREHVVDGEVVYAGDTAYVTVYPDNTVQLSVPARDYLESAFIVESGEGKGVLLDAGVSLD